MRADSERRGVDLGIIFGFIALESLIVVAILQGGALFFFVDTITIYLVSGLVFMGTVAAFPVRRLRDCLDLDLFREGCPVEAPLEKAEVFDRMADLAVYTGVICPLIGQVLMMVMMGNLSEPNNMGPAFAVCLLSLLYGVIFGELVLRGLATRCRNAAESSMLVRSDSE